jgi:hypothetical protein
MTTDPDPSAEEDAELIRREREYYLRLLEGIRLDRSLLEERERDFTRAARSAGIGWDLIAAALGTEPGEARERFGEPGADEAPF